MILLFSKRCSVFFLQLFHFVVQFKHFNPFVLFSAVRSDIFIEDHQCIHALQKLDLFSWFNLFDHIDLLQTFVFSQTVWSLRWRPMVQAVRCCVRWGPMVQAIRCSCCRSHHPHSSRRWLFSSRQSRRSWHIERECNVKRYEEIRRPLRLLLSEANQCDRTDWTMKINQAFEVHEWIDDPQWIPLTELHWTARTDWTAWTARRNEKVEEKKLNTFSKTVINERCVITIW